MSRYDAFPDHPLCGFPEEILEAARVILREAADWKDVEAEMVEPLADAVVINLLPWLVCDEVMTTILCKLQAAGWQHGRETPIVLSNVEWDEVEQAAWRKALS